MYNPTCFLFLFGFVCSYVSFFYFFPLHAIYYCSLCFHAVTLCVCAFVTLNKKITYLLTFLLKCGHSVSGSHWRQ